MHRNGNPERVPTSRAPAAAGVLVSAVLAACSSTPPIIPTKNLDRPTDMTFVCLSMPPGSDGLSGAPMTSCHNRGALDSADYRERPTGARDLRLHTQREWRPGGGRHG